MIFEKDSKFLLLELYIDYVLVFENQVWMDNNNEKFG